MSSPNLLEHIPADEWKAAPPATQALLQKLILIAEEVAELRERVALLENSRPLVPVAEDSSAARESHSHVEIFGTYGGPIWDEIFDEMECERQQEIAAEEALEAAKAA